MKGPIIGTIAVIVLVFSLMTFGWVNVHPTEVAVEVNKVMGKVSEQPKGVGYHFFNRWVTDMVIYRISARAFPHESMDSEKHEDRWNLSAKTIDGQGIFVDMTMC